jgi:membrane associated rhomboid family serine protease
MSTCDVCGRRENMPYRCNHCGGTHCAKHRLPEAHDCPGLDSWGDPGGVFDSGFDESVSDESGRSRSRDVLGRLSPDTSTGGIWGYFKGNVTYTFLALMWITFFLQFLLPIIFDFPIGGDTWSALFTIQPQHPEYVWTWFTSIFSHGGFGHIAGNSIIIFFFGRIVERYVGSKAFAALFLISGAVAGLGQIGLAHLEVALGISQSLGAGGLGASGAALAILGVLTILRPDLRVYLWFVLPIPIWVITIFYAGISVLGILPNSMVGGNVGHMAHLTGLIFGLAYGWHVKGRGRIPGQIQFGSRRGPGGPGGGGNRRGPF